jgi:hypothetical protein
VRAVITIPDGLAARNFCDPGFLAAITEQADTILWHHLTERQAAEIPAPWRDLIELEPLPPVADSRALAIVRLARTMAQLACFQDPNTSAALARVDSATGLRARTQRRLAQTLAASGSSRRGLARLDRLHDRLAGRLVTVAAAERFLRTSAADVVLITNQRSLPALPAALAARRLGIPVVTFVYSWDNLPKRRSTVLGDHWLVWGSRMRDHVLRYHPEVDPATVHVVGTPQFEVHTRAELLLDRAAFLHPLGLDPARPVICFSGDDATTSPFDQAYLADLATALGAVPTAEQPQILFRRAPGDRTDRYDRVLREHPAIAVSDPAWYSSEHSWEGVVPSAADQALLANVAAHCELVINVGSTMAMDFALLDKPAAYLAYQPAGATGAWDIDAIYRLPHFRSVHRTQPVHWVRSRDQLAAVVLDALADPTAKTAGRAAWLAEELTLPIAGAGARCAAVLAAVAAGTAAIPTTGRVGS